MSSSFAAAVYLKNALKFPADRKVYVMGMQGIEEELDAVNILHCGGTAAEDNQLLPANDFSSLTSEEAIDPSVGAVLCGFDMHMSYTKLCKAFKHITRKGAEGAVLAGEKGGGCHFILTNDDSIFPAAGEPWPGMIYIQWLKCANDTFLLVGAGSLAAPLICSSKREPIVIGKPHAPMLDMVKSFYKIDEKRAIFVGDNINTDILFAKHGNIDSLLVLTGISTESDCQAEGIWPSYIIQSIGDLAQWKGDHVQTTGLSTVEGRVIHAF